MLPAGWSGPHPAAPTHPTAGSAWTRRWPRGRPPSQRTRLAWTRPGTRSSGPPCSGPVAEPSESTGRRGLREPNTRPTRVAREPRGNASSTRYSESACQDRRNRPAWRWPQSWYGGDSPGATALGSRVQPVDREDSRMSRTHRAARIGLPLIFAAMALGVPAAVSAAPPPNHPTFRSDFIVGDEDANTLYGRAGADLIFGLGGDDTLYGNLGADRLFGGIGARQALRWPRRGHAAWRSGRGPHARRSRQRPHPGCRRRGHRPGRLWSRERRRRHRGSRTTWCPTIASTSGSATPVFSHGA